MTDEAGVDEIVNWLRLDARISTSGQPEEAQLAALAQDGVQRVINLGLHTHPKALPDEAGSLAALGIGYVHIPVPFDAPGEADFTRFVTALEASDDVRLHVHCIANYRVSAFFYRYRRDVLGLPEEAIRPDLQRIWTPNPVWQEFIAPR